MIFRAKLVCPIQSPPIPDGAIAVDDAGRIAAVGRAVDMPAGPINDLGHCLVLPGLINAHVHLDLAGPRHEPPPSSLWQWFETAILPRRIVTEGEIRKTVQAGADASLAAGVTCVADISRTGDSATVLNGSPIRKVCFIELISGASRPPNDAVTLEATLARLSTLESPNRLRLGITPHTPYTVTRAHAAAAVQLADSIDCPLTIHFLETAEEVAWLSQSQRASAAAEIVQRFLYAVRLPTRDEPPPDSPMDWLYDTGIATRPHRLGRGPLLAHVNYADDGVVAAMAAAGASVAWCPRTHNYFNHPPHRWRDMLAAGVNVCIGTDSLASNPDLSILGELRFARHLAPEAPPQSILKMATVNAALAIGWGDSIGDLVPGREADFITVPLPDKAPADLLGWLLDCDAPVAHTWIGGQPVYSHK